MATDAAQEWRQMQEVYARMSEDELQNVADRAYELTDVAKQVLEAEISGRKLEIKLNLEPVEPIEEEPEGDGDPDPEEAFELTAVFTAWDEQEARDAKKALDDGGVPSFFGPDNLGTIDEYKGSYERGVKLKVPSQFQQMAIDAFRIYGRNDDGAEGAEEEVAAPEVHCPQCRSEEVVFLSVERKPDESDVDSKFNWRCEACGNEWQDDGVEV